MAEVAHGGRWVQPDDLQVAIRPATDGALFSVLLAEIERQGLLDIDYIKTRTVGFDDAVKAARAWSLSAVRSVTDVPSETVLVKTPWRNVSCAEG